MAYAVKTAENRSTLKDFLRLPFEIYRNDPNWIPPMTSEVKRVLDERRNPYFTDATLRLFVCYKDRDAVARVAVVINRLHERKFGVRTAFFGFFECVNDDDAVDALFRQVAEYCRSERAKVLEGPFNPNHYSELGLQASNFGTPPSFFQTYNPPYYSRLLENQGFSVSARLFTARNVNIGEFIKRRYGDKNGLTQSGDLEVRSLDLSRLREDLESVREVFNDAFSTNWHFLPASKEEYNFSTKFLRLVTDPDLVKIAEYRGKPVGVVMCVLDINPLLRAMKGKIGPFKYLRFLSGRKRIRTLIVYAVGIKKAFQRTRAFELLFNSMQEMALKYEVLETTWTMPENILAVRAAERLGLVPDKQFLIYEKHFPL